MEEAAHVIPVSATSLENGFPNLQQDQQIQESLTSPDEATAGVKNKEDEAIDVIIRSNDNDVVVDTTGVDKLKEYIAHPVETIDNAIQTESVALTENNDMVKADTGDNTIYYGSVNSNSEINPMNVNQEDVCKVDDLSNTGPNEQLIDDGVTVASNEILVHLSDNNIKIDDENIDQGAVILSEPSTNEVISNNHEDSFGDFDQAEITNQSIEVVDANNDSNDDDDEFGDFDTAMPSPAVTSSENIQVPTMVDNVVDDDDFGDFDEAPATIQQTVETTTISLPSSAYGSTHDPIMEKVKTTLPNLFRRCIDENRMLEPSNDATDELVVEESIQAFTEIEMISVENVMMSINAEPMPNTGYLLQNSINILLERLFLHDMDKDNVAAIPSRYIKSKQRVVSPTKFPLSGRILVHAKAKLASSDPKNLALDEDGANAIENGVSNVRSDSDGPSEQAKDFIRRIPDLSFMLSSKLSMPETTSTIDT